jgi:flagellar hook-basal body complex protein FliE
MSNSTINTDALLAQMREMVSASQNRTQAQPSEANSIQSDFSTLLKESINAVSESQQEATRLSDAFQSGDPNVKMSEVMIALQKSNVSFQGMMQVRNKLVSAYQEIMNMPI